MKRSNQSLARIGSIYYNMNRVKLFDIIVHHPNISAAKISKHCNNRSDEGRFLMMLSRMKAFAPNSDLSIVCIPSYNSVYWNSVFGISTRYYRVLSVRRKSAFCVKVNIRTS